MLRKNCGTNLYLEVYHTQESRKSKLTSPIICNRADAWLGVGYYFWMDETFAHNWGNDSKKTTGYYDIYSALIDEEGILNATFDEKEYYFFVKSIEKARKYLAKTLNGINLQNVHRFLADKVWPHMGIKGIIFDDIPHNAYNHGRIYSDIKPLYYTKRIQIVIFDTKNIVTFVPHLLNEECK